MKDFPLMPVLAGFAGVMVVTIICGTALYGCSISNQAYYSAMKNCVESGGSAIPTGGTNGTSTIACVHGASR